MHKKKQMKGEIKRLEWWLAFINGYIEGLMEQTIEIEESKEMTYNVYAHKNGLAVKFEWVVGYKSNYGDYDNPPYNEEVFESQTFYFTFNEHTDKVKREIFSQLETIQDATSPEDNEMEEEFNDMDDLD